MRRRLLMLTLIFALCNILYGWEVGDRIDDISFTEVDFSGDEPVCTERSIEELTSLGKPVIIYFESISYA